MPPCLSDALLFFPTLMENLGQHLNFRSSTLYINEPQRLEEEARVALAKCSLLEANPGPFL